MKYRLRDGVYCVYDTGSVTFHDVLSGRQIQVHISIERGAFDGILEPGSLANDYSTIVKFLLMKKYLISCETDAYVNGLISKIINRDSV